MGVEVRIRRRAFCGRWLIFGAALWRFRGHSGGLPHCAGVRNLEPPDREAARFGAFELRHERIAGLRVLLRMQRKAHALFPMKGLYSPLIRL